MKSLVKFTILRSIVTRRSFTESTMKSLKNLLCFTILLPLASCFEPISTSIFIGLSAMGGYKYFNQIKEQTYCKFNECCFPNLIPHDILSLREQLQSRLFGQHIIEEKLFQAVASHYKEIDKSQKPLVMSFHGTQGTGKNFVSNLIAEAVFEKGTASQYYHIFHGSQYGDVDRVNYYREHLKNEIFKAIDKCPYSIFVFDEVCPKCIVKFCSKYKINDHFRSIRCQKESSTASQPCWTIIHS